MIYWNHFHFNIQKLLIEEILLKVSYHLWWCSCRLLTHWGQDKMAAVSQTTFFVCIFFNENDCIPINIFHWNVFLGGWIDEIPALVQIMAWHQPGGKPLSESMMVSLLTPISVTRPQWVNTFRPRQNGCHFSIQCFQINFLEWKLLLYFDWNFT